mgnify:CR=1 FL=1
MNHQHPQTTEQWIELIAHSELPAITSTARMLDKFSNDDKSSLPKLSEAILHDQGLSSCLLKVANNIQHIGVNKVTTVSRATVVLGIQSVKNICLTAKLVSSLLASDNLDISVYEQLTQLMANSFYAGMLAKMMVPNYSDEMQEEVYLAAMLYRIGETAFWSTGGNLARKLANDENRFADDYQGYCQQQMGTSFTELSKGLASTWNLSDLLIKALDQPTSRTDEVKIIYFSDKLSTIISQPGDNEEAFNQLLDEIAQIMQISVRQLKIRIEHTREQANKLLSSYGADILTEHIKMLPTAGDFSQAMFVSSVKEVSKEKALLTSFMKLTKLMKSSKDLNEYLHLTLTDMVTVFGFERCSFLMLVDEKSRVKSRLVINDKAQQEPMKIYLNIKESDNAIVRVLKDNTPALINDKSQALWRDLITQELSALIGEGSIAIVPVLIAGTAVGVICAQKLTTKTEISTEDFSQLCGLVEHLNMCLTMIRYQ